LPWFLLPADRSLALDAINESRPYQYLILVQLVEWKLAVNIPCDPVELIGAIVRLDGFVDWVSEVLADPGGLGSRLRHVCLLISIPRLPHSSYRTKQAVL
jgi:hypothetical protein